MEIEREVVDADVAFVGAGPLAAGAIHLIN